MYILNKNVPKDTQCRIILEPNRKFYQLIGNGVIAESDSVRRLKLYADKNNLILI